MFRNPQEEQNPKLSLEFNFEQDFMEKNVKTSATNEMLGTVYYNKIATQLLVRPLFHDIIIFFRYTFKI